MRFLRFVGLSSVFFVACTPLRAADASKLFLIPAESGYGIEECFAPGSSCGKVVADAYCEAHGYGSALAFGKSEDITASVVASTTLAAPDKSAFVVKCAS